MRFLATVNILDTHKESMVIGHDMLKVNAKNDDELILRVSHAVRERQLRGLPGQLIVPTSIIPSPFRPKEEE